MNNILFKYFPELNLQFTKKPDAKKHQRFLDFFINVIFAANNRLFRHNRGTGFVMHYKFIEKHLGNPSRFNYEELLSPYVWTDGSYKNKSKDAFARQWYMTPAFRTTSANFINDEERIETELAIRNAKYESIQSQNVEIEGIKMNSLFANENAEAELVKNAKQQKENAISDLINFMEYGHNDTLTYKVTDCGRLYHPMQLLTKNTKAIVFKNSINYDIEAAAPTLLSQYIELNAPDVKITAIKNYVANKDVIRKKLSKELAVNIDTIKSIFTGLFFGQTVPTVAQIKCDEETDKDFLSAITEQIGCDKALKLINNPLFMEIANETTAALKAIGELVKPVAKVAGEWEVVNAAGAVKKMKTWNAGKAAAHVYFGLERNITDICRKFVGDQGVLLMHDGFIVRNQINSDVLSEIIKKETGYDVVFSEEVL